MPKKQAEAVHMPKKPVKHQCESIKSKKHPDLRCPNAVTEEGVWCSRHIKSQVKWPLTPRFTALQTPPPVTKKQKTSATNIQRWWRSKGLPKIRQLQGPATFIPELAHNEKDIYSYDPVKTIPRLYRFSYVDEKKHCWLFDLRFLLQLLQYGNELKNPFTQELVSSKVTERLDCFASKLRKRSIPIVYLEADELTPEQIWNQKVLDVFLKLNALGYGANLLWFESMTLRMHEVFYSRLYHLWLNMDLSDEAKERIVPGHSSGRSPLFRWNPMAICGRGLEIKWWRKQNLMLMKAFLSRAEEKENQSTGALYILTALANTHSGCAQAFGWLVAT